MSAAGPASQINNVTALQGREGIWREHRGLTPVALAERSGVNRVQISNIEAGEKTGSVKTLKKLADALGVALDDLA